MSYNAWLVIYVMPKHEKKVFSVLQKNQIKSFLPLVKSKRKWSDREKEISLPLFPGYIFVYITSAKEFYNANNIKGVIDYIRCGDLISTVSDDEIKNIEILVKSNGRYKLQTAKRLPKPGQITKITKGVLSGLECEIVRAESSSFKVIVRVESLKQNIVALVPSEFFEKSN